MPFFLQTIFSNSRSLTTKEHVYTAIMPSKGRRTEKYLM